MPPRARRLRTLAVVLACLGTGLVTAQAPQPSQTQPAPVKGTGFLLGQIVDAGTNKPIPGAIVNLGGGGLSTVQLPTGEIVQTAAAPPGTPGATPVAPRQIIADAAGRFMFRELNQGTYTVRASASGYIAGVFGQNRPNGGTQSIVLERDDEKRGGLVVRLWQGGTISGRVTDEFGEPSVEVPLKLVRRTFINGKPRLAAGVSVSTDDRGLYRFANVAPGDYVVAIFTTSTTLPAATGDAYMQAMSTGGLTAEMSSEASISGAPYPSASGIRVGDFIYSSGASLGRDVAFGMLLPPTGDGRVLAYPTTFYPNVASPSQATVVSVASGDDRTAIDFQLKLRRTLIVSGTVTGPDGPMKGVGLKLLPLNAEEYSSLLGIDAAVTATDASGAFTFLGVSPGAYTLQCIRVPRVQPPRGAMTSSVEVSGPNGMIIGMSMGAPTAAPLTALPTDPTLWGGMAVTVGETDVHNVAVVLRPGARLSGRLVFEGASERPPVDVIQRISISISSIGGSMPSQVSLAQKRIDAEGNFSTVGYPPGRYTVSASIPPAPARGGGGPSWRLKNATLGGRDLSDEGLEIENNDINGLALVFTDRPTEITGTVVNAKSEPDTGAVVIVIPADSQAWKEGIVSPRRVRSVRTTTKGAFTMADLPPGEYFIAAVSDAALDNWQDPKKLEAVSRVATRVTLGDGAKLSQRLTTVTVK